MNERIQDKLVGSEEVKRRRVEFLAELTKAYADGASQAVTDTTSERMDKFVGVFASQLEQLKKQL